VIKQTEIGTFVKTASPQVVEVLGTTDLGFVVVDAEHAPFDRGMLDLMVMAGRASQIPVFIRIAEINASVILSCLDIGAAGLLIPHVDNAEIAKEVVSLARYVGGKRGFSSSPRFAGYGSLGMKESLKLGESPKIICQIESQEAIDNVEAIASVSGVSGIFVGRADLALSLGLDNPRDESVFLATLKSLNAALKLKKMAGIHVSGKEELDKFKLLGANWFVVSSDQTLLRQSIAGFI